MRVSPRPFRTLTFRLSALYLLLFALSSLAVLGYIYYSTASLLAHESETAVMADVNILSAIESDNGPKNLKNAIERRVTGKSGLLYMMTDANGAFIAGNLRSPTVKNFQANTWVDFVVTADDRDSLPGHHARGYNTKLADDTHLIVARDVNDLLQFQNLVRHASLWGLGLAVFLGLGSGLVISRNFLHRIDEITIASRRIMLGDFTGRMPITGSGDELDRLSQSLNDMLAQIERLMFGMRNVSGNVAHDLRTPLTRLRARIEAALRSNSKATHRKALRAALSDTDALLATFNALLSIDQIEAGHLRTGFVAIDAQEVLSDVADLYAPVAEEAGGSLTLNTQDGLKLNGRRELLAQAIVNLVDNALKYGMASNGASSITIEGSRVGREIILGVADTGAGVAPQDRERVLQRFVRLDESRSKPGNGLGLSLVVSIAHLLGGKLILSDNGPGLRAELRLPALLSEM